MPRPHTPASPLAHAVETLLLLKGREKFSELKGKIYAQRQKKMWKDAAQREILKRFIALWYPQAAVTTKK